MKMKNNKKINYWIGRLINDVRRVSKCLFLNTLKNVFASNLDVTAIERCLIISPHPDDETFGCGNLIASLCKEGKTVKVLFLSKGERSCCIEANKLKHERMKLAENANRMLGCKNVEFLDWPDGGFLANENNELLCGGLLKKIMEYNPSAIFYPHCYDNTEDHRAVCRIMKKMMQHSVVKQFMYCVWLWDDTPWKELMKLRSVNALVLKSENNYKSNAVDYYVNSSIDGVRLSGNLPVLFTKMIKLKNELYFRL